VVDPAGQVFALSAFWVMHEDLLHRGMEYWMDVGAGSPAPSRASAPATEAARAAWRSALGAEDEVP
jgi:hypothetical protein